jgi:hypothetical protein
MRSIRDSRRVLAATLAGTLFTLLLLAAQAVLPIPNPLTAISSIHRKLSPAYLRILRVSYIFSDATQRNRNLGC